MKSLPEVDAVIIGGGWSGLLMAKELGVRTALTIVVLERGGPHHTRDYAADMDELDYVIHTRLMQDYSKETVTLRHTVSDGAIPIRQMGSFLPGNGIGGAGEHWGAVFPRLQPDVFELYSRTVEKYGAKKLPEGHSIQDWGVTWEEIEPYYARAEDLIGVSGKAGNLQGRKIDGGNVFEGSRSTEYPMPPIKTPYVSSLFTQAAKNLGYHPYPIPTAVNSESYTNSDGVNRPGCFYCGFCNSFGCMIGAKGQPSNTLLPVIEKQKRVTIRTGATARRILVDKSAEASKAKRKVRGVTYVDASGEEVFQPAGLVFLASWTFNNARLLLLSGLGDPYDPMTRKGTLGRNLTHQLQLAVQAFFDKPLNRFMGAGGAGVRISDFEGDVFDHANLTFIRGGNIGVMGTGTLPITSFGVVPQSMKERWGSEWKKTAVEYYDRLGAVSFGGDHIPYSSNYLGLDPIYKDDLGDPLLRLTLDWHENERKMLEFIIPKAIEMAHAMGAKEIIPGKPPGHYDVTRYQTTHVHGGTIMAASPDKGVLNPYLQHWQYSNLFVIGGSAFPQSSGEPTSTILALTCRTADAVIDRYLKRPGFLA